MAGLLAILTRTTAPDIDTSDTKIEAFIERRRKEFRREWEDYMDHFYSDEEPFIF